MHFKSAEQAEQAGNHRIALSMYEAQAELANGHKVAEVAQQGAMRCRKVLNVQYAAPEMLMVLQAAQSALKGTKKFKHLLNDINAVVDAAMKEGK